MLAALDSSAVALVCGLLAVIVGVYLTRSFSRGSVALNRNQYCNLRLVEREQLTPNVFRFRFALPSQHHVLGLPTGKHVTLSHQLDSGKTISRTYTPVSGNDQIGSVDFVIKVYFKAPPRFPEGGLMSQHLYSMSIGDTIRAIGPKGHLHYRGRGTFDIKHVRSGGFEGFEEVKTVKRVGMIAGGTGLTPMLQLVREAMKDPQDTTQWSLLFANQSPDDVMLKKELDELAGSSERFNVWYTVDKASPDWEYSEGFINAEMIAKHLPPKGSDSQTLMLVCGPPPMVQFACLPAFAKLGFTEEDVLFEGMPKSTKAIFHEFSEKSAAA